MRTRSIALWMILGLLTGILSCAAYGQTILYRPSGALESFHDNPFTNNRWTAGGSILYHATGGGGGPAPIVPGTGLIYVQEGGSGSATTKESFSINPTDWGVLSLKYWCRIDAGSSITARGE